MKRFLKRFLLAGLGVLIFAGLVGCGADDERPLRLGSNVWPGYELFYVARDMGWYDRKNISLVEFRSANQVIHALQSGAINAAGLTLDEALQVVDAGVEVQIIAVLDYSNGADALIAAPGITAPGQLRGKRIALENSTVGGYLLRRFLQSADMHLSDVVIVPAANLEQEAVMARHAADAVVTFDPVRQRLLDKGYRMLFSSAQIPGEIVDVLVVLRDERAPSAQAIRDLLRGFYKAHAMLKADASQFAGLAQQRMKIPAADISAAYDAIIIPEPPAVSAMMRPGGQLENQVTRLGVYLSDVGRIAGACSCSDLLDSRYISELIDSGALQ